MRASAKGAVGTCRRDRRRPQAARRTGWVRPYFRAQFALDAAMRMIFRTHRTMVESERCAHLRPVRTWRDLHNISALLMTAARKLECAARKLAQIQESIDLEPERSCGVPDLLVRTTEMWVFTAELLWDTSNELFSMQADLLEALRSGVLVAEQEPEPPPRRRIIVKPRPVPIRAFLLARQPRVKERINPILRRRRRTPRPAAVRVPRRNTLGRAPPLLSTCAL